MIDLNKVFIIGNLTRDPELKYTSSGKAVCNFSIANNQDYGETKKANFFDITAWNKTAEICGQYLKKGSKIALEGTLDQERWEKDGQHFSKVKIVANQIQFLSSKKDDVLIDEQTLHIPENNEPLPF